MTTDQKSRPDILALALEHKVLNQLTMTLTNKLEAAPPPKPPDAARMEKEKAAATKRSKKVWFRLLGATPQTGLEVFAHLHAVLMYHVQLEDWYEEWDGDKVQIACLANLGRVLGVSEAETQEVKNLFLYGPE